MCISLCTTAKTMSKSIRKSLFAKESQFLGRPETEEMEGKEKNCKETEILAEVKGLSNYFLVIFHLPVVH